MKMIKDKKPFAVKQSMLVCSFGSLQHSISASLEFDCQEPAYQIWLQRPSKIS